MATPTILFNNASGSDTAASGAGPTTALSGTSASYSGSVFTLDGSPDLSGVSTDGSHVIWVQTSTGRQFFTISAVDDGADTVTVDDAPAGTTTGLTWGLGGKRKTLDNSDSRLLLSADAKSAWIIELEDDQTLTSKLDWDAAGAFTEAWTILRGTSGAKRAITQSASGADVLEIDDANGYLMKLQNIKLAHSHATNGDGIASLGNGIVCLEDCELGDATNSLDNGIVRTGNAPQWILLNTWIHDCDGYGVDSNSTSQEVHVMGCTINDNGDDGISLVGHLDVAYSTIYDNGGSGIMFSHPQCWAMIIGNTIHSNTGDGIEATNSNQGQAVTIFNNNITGNGGYGINGATDRFCIDYNNYGTGGTANTSGAVNGVSQGDNDVEVDPGYGDAANGDFSVGTNLKAAGFPGAFPDGNSTGYLDIGAVQREEPAGGDQAKLRRVIHIGEGVSV